MFRPLAAVLWCTCLVAGCSGAGDRGASAVSGPASSLVPSSAGLTGPVDTLAPIAHPTGADDVVLQVGAYLLGRTIPDHDVEMPTLVIYGDLRAFGRIDGSAGPRWASGRVDRADVVALLRTAAMLPDEAPDGAAREAGDDFGVELVAGDRRWRVYPPGLIDADPFVALLDDVWSAGRPALVDPWVPSAWIEQPEWNGPCVVVAEPDVDPWLAAPIFPHLVDRYPLGPASCATPA